MSLGSNSQLCLAPKFGIEFAIHALRDQYSKTSADAVLLIDAENAFNSLNRKLAFKNTKKTCPSPLSAIKNSYSIHLNCSLTKKHLISRRDSPGGSKSNCHIRSSHNNPQKTFISRQRNPVNYTFISKQRSR